MKPKKLPPFIRNEYLVRFFQSRKGRLLTAWTCQGMLYMDPVETLYKLALDGVLTVAWWLALLRPTGAVGALLCLALAHTTNWLLNGQPVAMRRHLGMGRNDPRKFVEYVEGLDERLRKREWIGGAAFFGSLSRGQYRETSDIDLRIVTGPGFFEKLRTAHLCFLERARAALLLFPLDLYAFDIDDLRRKMEAREEPVIFSDPRGLLARAYARTVPFASFAAEFRRNVLEGQADQRR